jgi:hypothetical protein
MKGQRFDALTRAMATGASRRRLLKIVLAGVAGGPLARRDGHVAAAQPKCREAGHPCEGNQVCCEGLVCGPSGPGAANRCTPPGGCEAGCEQSVAATAPFDVEVECGYDSGADQTTCRFKAVARADGATVNAVVLPAAEVCADVVGGDYVDVESVSEKPGKGRKGRGYKSKKKDEAGDAAVVTLVLVGKVEVGATASYWCATENGVFPASGPGLVCAETAPLDDISDSTGAIVVEVSTCGAESYPDDFDWYGECGATTEATTFALSVWDGTRFVEEGSGTTDADGIVRFGQLEPGTYNLEQVDATWCHAECDSVNEKGEVIVKAGERANVWIFNCVDGATPSATEPA